MPNQDIHIFGIRHHGPGSARSLMRALDALNPDIVLVEGPPDADSAIPLAVSAEMRPPVAILVYVPDAPQQSVYYPFAEFSPEWQAIRWALHNHIPVRFMDLPQAHQLPMRLKEADAHKDHADDGAENMPAQSDTPDAAGVPSNEEAMLLRRDPLRALAEAAGYGDGERWWDHMVEQRADSTDVFAAILEAMTAVRAAADATSPPETLELQREAYMRQTIRAAQKDGRSRIAVVCGAWHAPALASMGPAKTDKALLDGLDKVKTACSWIPWTHSRLSYTSGYGAGIESPGWYQHLWSSFQDSGTPPQPSPQAERENVSGFPPLAGGPRGVSDSFLVSADTIAIPWMTRVAHLLRAQDLDASTASVIEAVRMADCLAALRGRPLPGLPELNEATQTVLCFGSDLPMRLIARKLIVGEVLGEVPEDAPAVPLQQDLQRSQKRLRLPAEDALRMLELDLRKPVDLERSELLHRLNLLGVGWGAVERATGGKGTFHENWRLQWQPEFSVTLIEKGIWGNTVYDAASAFASDRASALTDLPPLTALLDAVMRARLPDALRLLMSRLEAVAANAGDIRHLMDALGPLVNVARYGDVRGTDAAMIMHTLDGLVARICVGLGVACASLDDAAATAMSTSVASTHRAIGVMENAAYTQEWNEALTRLVGLPNLHGLIGGQGTRLLLDAGVFTNEDAGRRLGLALSTASEPAQAASWVEGFLMGSALVLIHDPELWQLLDAWVAGLDADAFTALLPLLRRTFSTFSAPERRQLGDRARAGHTATAVVDEDELFDHARAASVLPYVELLLGLSVAAKSEELL